MDGSPNIREMLSFLSLMMLSSRVCKMLISLRSRDNDVQSFSNALSYIFSQNRHYIFIIDIQGVT